MYFRPLIGTPFDSIYNDRQQGPILVGIYIPSYHLQIVSRIPLRASGAFRLVPLDQEDAWNMLGCGLNMRGGYGNSFVFLWAS